MNQHYKAVLISLFVLPILMACDGNCKDETLEKVEWVTTEKSEMVDTLLTYSVLENKTEFDYNTKSVVNSVVIQNDDLVYANNFSIAVFYNVLNANDEIEERVCRSEEVEIKPKSAYRFIVRRYVNSAINLNSNVLIRQPVLQIMVPKRKDELMVEKIIVNSCEANIEALKEKYKIIEELYNTKL
jgi:hypothetical protein